MLKKRVWWYSVREVLSGGMDGCDKAQHQECVKDDTCKELMCSSESSPSKAAFDQCNADPIMVTAERKPE